MDIDDGSSDIPKYYEDIVDIAPIGILTFDYNEKILIINQQMSFYFGKSPKELIGKNVKVVFSEINPEILIIIDAVKNRKSIYEEFFSADFPGSKYFFNIKGVVLPEQGLLIFENVTGIKEYQDELKSLDKAKNEFISIASHDLRTPITAIRGYLDMVLKEEVGIIATPKMKEYLELAREGVLRLNDLVEDILSVSRIEQKRMTFNLQNIDVSFTIDQIIRQFTSQAFKKGLYLKFEKPLTNIPTVQADNNRLCEILTNLIGNGLKFTSSGGITIRVIPRNDHVRIDCIDTGIGIGVQDQSKIFNKFVQIDASSSSQSKGTGLGLYISKMMTEKMGGRIDVSSSPNKGSDFFFTLPYADTPNAKRTAEEIRQETLALNTQKIKQK